MNPAGAQTQSATWSVEPDTERRAVDVLHEASGLPKTRIKEAMSKGAVWCKRGQHTQRLRRASASVSAGETLSLYYHPAILSLEPPAPTLIEDCTSYSVWYKPRGLMCSGTRFGDHHSITRCVEKYLDRPTFLVHRLDRYTQGLLVLAHTKSCAAHISKQFAQRDVTKRYHAFVYGKLSQATTVRNELAGKTAVSHIKPLQPGPLPDTTHVEVTIDTGRKHQIRQHLAQFNHPVVGDRQYGHDSEHNLQLAAVELSFDCPDTQVRKDFTLPKQFGLEADIVSGTT